MKMAFAFAGCFLEAGYVSGQELWQWFGSICEFSKKGVVFISDRKAPVVGRVCMD